MMQNYFISGHNPLSDKFPADYIDSDPVYTGERRFNLYAICEIRVISEKNGYITYILGHCIYLIILVFP